VIAGRHPPAEPGWSAVRKDGPASGDVVPLARRCAALLVLIALSPPSLRAQSDASPSVWLARARRALGMDPAAGAVLRVSVAVVRELSDQSDRTYPPYLEAVEQDTLWLDPATATMLTATSAGPARFLRSPAATYRLGSGGPVPDPRFHSRLWSDWPLNPWAVLAEWSRGGVLSLERPRTYRDYPRIVLARTGPVGVERLLLDQRTGVPVALQRTEPHYFTGPGQVEYLWQTWQAVDGGALYPYVATRMVDGRPAATATLLAPGASAALVARNGAPSLALPDTTPMPVDPGSRFPAAAVDTVAAGAGTWLLASDVFTSVATLQADTVYLLDATAGADRAARDAAWVERLFPGRHPVVVVALNPVWPHVAGLAAWVARGATVVTARAGAPFLRRHLERSGHPVHLRVMADSLALGGGALRLYAMEGINGEGVALAYVAPAGLVWATDHIQDLAVANTYVEEVRRTVERHRLQPRWTSGPHLRLVPWDTVAALPRVRVGWGLEAGP
jgi:hypothetical protein